MTLKELKEAIERKIVENPEIENYEVRSLLINGTYSDIGIVNPKGVCVRYFLQKWSDPVRDSELQTDFDYIDVLLEVGK